MSHAHAQERDEIPSSQSGFMGQGLMGEVFPGMTNVFLHLLAIRRKLQNFRLR